jgi:RNA ligase
MMLDIEKLRQYETEGWLNIQKHPSKDIYLAKYSRQTVYSRHWDEVTKLCRGIWFNSTGKVLAYPFEKFFNHSEADGTPVYESCKNLSYQVFTKMDGSLIIASLVNGELIVSSSGSFTSDHAIKAEKMLKACGFPFSHDLTYCFELIAPEFKIVVDYGNVEKLTLLGIRDTNTGKDIPFTEDSFSQYGIQGTKQVNMTLDEIEQDLKRSDYINAEGYVILFENGERVKMKYDKYMELHKLISNITEKFIWECLRDGVDFEAQLVNIPDELFEFVKATKAKLSRDFLKEEVVAKTALIYVKRLETRKEQAELIMRNFKPISSVLFRMLDGREYADLIWKKIEPEFTKPRGMGDS